MIKAEMKRQGWSANKLASKAKLKPSIVSRAFAGLTDPEEKTLDQLAKALNLELPPIGPVAPPGSVLTKHKEGAGRPAGRVSEHTPIPGGDRDWPADAGRAMAITLKHAIERGVTLKTVALYLLDLSTRGADYGMDEVRELVDLARRCLWEDEHPQNGSMDPPPMPSRPSSSGTSSTEAEKGSSGS